MPTVNASTLRHYPLGSTLNGSVHSVCLSLPTMADVIGYEEKDPRVVSKILSGYPRFTTHQYIRALTTELARRHDVKGRSLALAASEQSALELAHFAGMADHHVRELDGLHGVLLPAEDAEAARQAAHYLQHTGTGLSSREAEDRLVALGLLRKAQAEALVTEDPEQRILSTLRPVLGAQDTTCLHLCRGGMNGFYASFKALQAHQAQRGRRRWIQLGWLYVDTHCILQKWLPPDRPPHLVHTVLNLQALESLLAQIGNETAAIVTEIPTNPLLQTCDVPRLRSLCDRYGIALILDPSLVSPLNVDVLPFADVHICSLTKYAGCSGDVLMGCVTLNPQSSFYEPLCQFLPQHLERPYLRDLQRMAHTLKSYDEVVRGLNENCAAVAYHLEKHPRVKRVYWARQSEARRNYAAIERKQGGPGSVISLTLDRPLERFYDRLRMAKSPSFGTTFSLINPFMYLAHYDLVSNAAGRQKLLRYGLEADLLRLSVGLEPAEEIIAVLDEALQG